MNIINKLIKIYKSIKPEEWIFVGNFCLYVSVFLEMHKVFINDKEQNGFILIFGLAAKIFTKIAEKSKKENKSEFNKISSKT
jgi:hypothetical protein